MHIHTSFTLELGPEIPVQSCKIRNVRICFVRTWETPTSLSQKPKIDWHSAMSFPFKWPSNQSFHPTHPVFREHNKSLQPPLRGHRMAPLCSALYLWDPTCSNPAGDDQRNGRIWRETSKCNNTNKHNKSSRTHDHDHQL